MTGGPLTGIRVLDLTRVIAGPQCTRLLSDLGAEVIKLEPPRGDQLRRFGRPGPVSSSLFVQFNAGKRMISVDLDRPESRELVRRLAGQVDVMIENFRPGVVAEWGLDHASLAPDLPRLIYLSISGYGQRGAWRHRRAYAPFVHAESGYLDTVAQLRTSRLEHDPMSLADLAASKDATISVLAALFERERTGRGTYIDISLAHSILHFNEFATALLNPDGKPIRSGSAAQCIFVTADGQGFSAGNPVSSEAFAPMCRALGCPELIDDPRFIDSASRRERRAELIDVLQKAVERFGTIDEIEKAVNAEGLVIGRVRTVADVPATEWVAERGALTTVRSESGDEVVTPSSPWVSAPDQRLEGAAVARVGADNAAVLHDLLGLSDADVQGLYERGVLWPPLPADGAESRSAGVSADLSRGTAPRSGDEEAR